MQKCVCNVYYIPTERPFCIPPLVWLGWRSLPDGVVLPDASFRRENVTEKKPNVVGGHADGDFLFLSSFSSPLPPWRDDMRAFIMTGGREGERRDWESTLPQDFASLSQPPPPRLPRKEEEEKYLCDGMKDSPIPPKVIFSCGFSSHVFLASLVEILSWVKNLLLFVRLKNPNFWQITVVYCTVFFLDAATFYYYSTSLFVDALCLLLLLHTTNYPAHTSISDRFINFFLLSHPTYYYTSIITLSLASDQKKGTMKKKRRRQNKKLHLSAAPC